MFKLRPEIERLDISSADVLQLYRSTIDVQVALSGFPAQNATAYLCVFSSGRGIRVTVVFHLLTSSRLVFFFHERGELPRRELLDVLEEGQEFADSMGFMLHDMDMHRLDPASRQRLWTRLPLERGLAAPAEPALSQKSAAAPPAKVPVVAPSPPQLPTPQEMEERRLRLQAGLGRFFAAC